MPNTEVTCGTCKRTGRKCETLECTVCKQFCHFVCVGIKSREEAGLRAHTFACPACHRESAIRDLNLSERSATSDEEPVTAALEELKRRVQQLTIALDAKSQEYEELRLSFIPQAPLIPLSAADIDQLSSPVNRNPTLTRHNTETANGSTSGANLSTTSVTTNTVTFSYEPAKPVYTTAASNQFIPDQRTASYGLDETPVTSNHPGRHFHGPSTPFTDPPRSTPSGSTQFESTNHGSANYGAAGCGTTGASCFNAYGNGAAGFDASGFGTTNNAHQTYSNINYAATPTMPCYRQTKTEPLPLFDGTKPEAWVSFEAVYRHLKSTGFQKDELISEISTAVKGNARRFIEDLLIIRGDPDVMIATLKRRYGDPNQVLGDIVRAIERTKPPRDLPKDQLLDFALRVKSLVTTATAFRNESYLDHPFLCDKIVDMLRDEHRDWWRMQRRSNPRANIADLSEYLLDRATDPSATRDTRSLKSRQREATTFLHDEPSDNQSWLRCFNCQEKHRLRMCPKFKEMAPQERMNWIKTTGVCSCCLSSTTHFWRNCTVKRECGVNQCKYYHHPLLHFNVSTKADGYQKPIDNSNKQTNKEVDLMAHNDGTKTLFQIVPVLLETASGSLIKEFAFIDTGSNRTLMEESLYQKLGLSGIPGSIKLKWTQNVETVQQKSYTTNVKIRSLVGNKWSLLRDVSTVKNLNLPTQSLNVDALRRKYPNLRHLPLVGYQNAKPSILIGLQHANACVDKRVMSGGDNEPVVAKTPLGWVVFGRVDEAIMKPLNEALCNLHVTMSDDYHCIDQQLRTYFSIEGLGVNSITDITPPTDAKAIKIAEETLEKVKDRYQIGLLWKSNDIHLPNNYKMAVTRLESFEKSLKRKPALLEWTNNRIAEMINLGYLRPATDEEIRNEGPRVWYLPTFIIINRNKQPPKPRLVFDAAATHKGVSLNSALLTGPDLVTPLIDGTCRFRESEFVVTGDVREMYHQVQIAPSDQQAQRVLWRNCDSSKAPQIFVLQVMAFGTAPSSFSAQYVKNSHASKYLKEYPAAAKAIIEYMYVDDYLNGHDSIDDAVQTTNEVIKILDEAGFQLRAIQSNSVEIMRQCPQDRINTQLVDLHFDFQPDILSKILGICWNPKNDTLTYVLNEAAFPTSFKGSDEAPTKRELLSAIMKIFDPMGHVAHILIRGKMILQRVWLAGTEWDKPIPESLIGDWTSWVQLVRQIDTISIPRRYVPVNLESVSIELHVFCDGSEMAFATTAFIRVVH